MRYKPKGNIDSEADFKENVERGTFDPTACNCSAVICQPEQIEEKEEEEEEENQGLDSPEMKLHNNVIPRVSPIKVL